MAGFSFRTLLSQLRNLGEQPEERGVQQQMWATAYWDNYGGTSRSGINVTKNKALEHTAVWAAVRLLSNTVAGLPFQVVEKTANGRQIAGFHPLYNLIHSSPNDIMTSFTYRQVLMLDMLLHGNAYAYIHRGTDERPVALEPISPNRMTVYFDDGKVFYKIDEGEPISASQIIHCKGLTADGITGLSPISFHREAIGSGLAAQEYSGDLLSNGITATGVIEMDGMPKAEQINDLKQQLGRQFSGKSTNKDGIAVLYGGMKFNRIAISPVDAQFLEQRQFSVTEVARIFGVQPHMIQDLSRATNNNIEQQSLEFVQYSLLPWVKTIEQEHDRKIFRIDERSRFGTKLNVDGLLRGDIATRAEMYQKGINSGWMTRDEARRLENMPPLADGMGDVPLVPVNLTTMKKLTQDEQQ